MSLDTTDSLEGWVRALPASKMIRPTSLTGQVQYVFWRLYTPWHPFFRDTLTTIGVLKPHQRQDFLLGTIAPHLTIQEFISLLVDQGFGNHFVAWKDEGEVVSLRYVEDFTYQYHLRVFKDREVRGHYEYTPECHPRWHLQEVGLENRHTVFFDFFGDALIANPELLGISEQV